MDQATHQRKEKTKFFYGWLVVLGGSLVMGTGIGLYANCNGVFVKPVTEALGFARGQFLLYPTIASTLGMLTSILYGQLYQTKRIKPFMTLGAIVCSACVVGYSFCTKIWQFYLLATIYGVCATPIMTMTVAILINNWFVEKKGLATGLAFCGSGFTAAIMTQVLTKVILAADWRWAYRVLGVTGFALTMTAILFLIKERPEDIGLQKLGADKVLAAPTGAAPTELPGILRRQALREPSYYFMILAFFTLMLVGMGINPSVVAYLETIGYSKTLAASVSSLYLAIMVGAKVILGAAYDKLGATKSAILTGALMTASALSLLFAGLTPFMPYVFALCYGFGYGTLTVSLPYITGENFGTREYALIYSMATMMSGLGGSVGMPLTGYIFDITQSYATAWTLYVGIALTSLVFMTASTVMSRRKGLNGRREIAADVQ